MKVGLLECDHVLEKFRHIAGDYRDMFSALLAVNAPQIELQFFDVRNGEFPSSPDDCEAYLTTGSSSSAYDDADWIHTLKGFVRRLRDTNKPFVGVCFGHQVLAQALGGRVEKAKNGWGVGAHSIEIAQPDAWMKPEQSNCRLQFTHQDQVTWLPENSLALGRSDHCPVAMFRVGETMLGIQPHPEFNAAYTEALILDRVERIGEAKVRAAQASFSQATDEAVVARWIVEFLESRKR